jgi:calmodulin
VCAYAAAYRDVFHSFDRDHDGRITVADLLTVAHQLGLPGTERDLGQLIGKTNIDVRGKLDFNTFLVLMSRSREDVALQDAEHMRQQQEDEMRQAFKVFDRDGNGLIDQKELRTTMKNLGEKLSKDDVKAMIKAADKNGDGKIDYEEFIRMMYAK